MGLQTHDSELKRQNLNAKSGGVIILTGRWFVLDSAGVAIAPGSGSKVGALLAIEGTHKHIGTPTEFGNSGTGYASTNAIALPSNVAGNAVALALPPVRFTVGSEGVDPAASLIVGSIVEIDDYGRLVLLSGGRAAGRVLAVTIVSSKITSVTIQAIA